MKNERTPRTLADASVTIGYAKAFGEPIRIHWAERAMLVLFGAFLGAIAFGVL